MFKASSYAEMVKCQRTIFTSIKLFAQLFGYFIAGLSCLTSLFLLSVCVMSGGGINVYKQFFFIICFFYYATRLFILNCLHTSPPLFLYGEEGFSSRTKLQTFHECEGRVGKLPSASFKAQW
jgi:hypothetical protein